MTKICMKCNDFFTDDNSIRFCPKCNSKLNRYIGKYFENSLEGWVRRLEYYDKISIKSLKISKFIWLILSIIVIIFALNQILLINFGDEERLFYKIIMWTKNIAILIIIYIGYSVFKTPMKFTQKAYNELKRRIVSPNYFDYKDVKNINDKFQKIIRNKLPYYKIRKMHIIGNDEDSKRNFEKWFDNL